MVTRVSEGGQPLKPVVTGGQHFIEMVLGIIYVHINPSSTYILFYQPPIALMALEYIQVIKNIKV